MPYRDFVKSSLDYLKPIAEDLKWQRTKDEKSTDIPDENGKSTDIKLQIKPPMFSKEPSTSSGRDPFDVSEVESKLLILADLTMADPVHVLMKENGFEALKRVITSFKNEEVVINSINVICNIALMSPQYRDITIGSGMFETLVKEIMNTDSVAILEAISRAIHVICCGYVEHLPKLPKLSFSEELSKLILTNDQDTQLNACMVLSCICDEEVYEFENKREPVFDFDVCRRLVFLLDNTSLDEALGSASLFAIAMLASLNISQSQLLVKAGCINSVSEIAELKNMDGYTEKSICIFAKHICTTADEDVLEQLFESSLFPFILRIIGDPFGPDTGNKRLISGALKSVTAMSSSEQIKELVNQNIIVCMLRNLKVEDDNEYLLDAMIALKAILDQGDSDGTKEYQNIFNEYLGPMKFEKIMKSGKVSKEVQELGRTVLEVSRKKKGSKISLLGSIRSMASSVLRNKE